MRNLILLLALLTTQAYAGKDLIAMYVPVDGMLVNACQNNNGIPAQTALNNEYPVTVTYVNQISIDVINFYPYFSEGFILADDNCPPTLAQGTSCVIHGAYKPTALGVNTFIMYYRAGLNTFYCKSTTTTTQYVGNPELQVDLSASTPFQTYYPTSQIPETTYVIRNVGTSPATTASVQITGSPIPLSPSGDCSIMSYAPNATCTITFHPNAAKYPVLAGVYDFNITITYNGKQMIYKQTIVVGDDKIMGCKIG